MLRSVPPVCRMDCALCRRICEYARHFIALHPFVCWSPSRVVEHRRLWRCSAVVMMAFAKACPGPRLSVAALLIAAAKSVKAEQLAPVSPRSSRILRARWIANTASKASFYLTRWKRLPFHPALSSNGGWTLRSDHTSATRSTESSRGSLLVRQRRATVPVPLGGQVQGLGPSEEGKIVEGYGGPGPP